MCGIVAGVSTQNIVPVLIQGLERLEYRGYDSCGLAVYEPADAIEKSQIVRSRSTSRVADLAAQIEQFVDGRPLTSILGIAHTRWATHGAPSVSNAHPHFSHGKGDGTLEARIALVHNGIIENHDELRKQLQKDGYVFTSQTDTEVIAHLIDSHYHGDLLTAVQQAMMQLRGAYSIAVFCRQEHRRLVGARVGSPLVLGLQADSSDEILQECFLASDAVALAGRVNAIVYLEDGDSVEITANGYQIFNQQLQAMSREERSIHRNVTVNTITELGPYRHYMQKEIFEQPETIASTLEGVLDFVPDLFFCRDAKQSAKQVFEDIDQVLVLACGSSFFTGCVAKYWLEAIAGIPCHVEIASEYRYRISVPNPRILVMVISQSGETADTLAALKHAKSLGMEKTLAICNVPTSAMIRECLLSYITRAGVESGVASTKAFTAQLVALFLLTLTLAQMRNRLSQQDKEHYLKELRGLPVAVQAVLALEPQIMGWSEQFASKTNALFLGRGMHYPIAQEGALKLKEISYIHAESYASGELKHGPLALVTKDLPVVAVAPNDALIEKLKSNLHEVRARGGVLYVLTDMDTHIESDNDIHVIRMPENYGDLSPILYVIALQLLSYHTACALGTDIDKPRNLAKSVTVE